MSKFLYTELDAAFNKLTQPKWQWVVDGESVVYSDKDNPPTHALDGHWEYVPTLEEVYNDEISLSPKPTSISPKGLRLTFGRR